jgi:pimeloyl-ACP methyl ester carboxylesterase
MDEIIKLVRPIMEDRKDSQISVVLVHGAFADGLCWSKVIPLLRAKDLNAVAVQNSLNSLADDVAATKSVLDGQDGAVILAGHLLNRSANTARLAKTSRHGSRH